MNHDYSEIIPLLHHYCTMIIIPWLAVITIISHNHHPSIIPSSLLKVILCFFYYDCYYYYCSSSSSYYIITILLLLIYWYTTGMIIIIPLIYHESSHPGEISWKIVSLGLRGAPLHGRSGEGAATAGRAAAFLVQGRRPPNGMGKWWENHGKAEVHIWIWRWAKTYYIYIYTLWCPIFFWEWQVFCCSPRYQAFDPQPFLGDGFFVAMDPNLGPTSR